ncbi:MAG: hypothetical protein ACT4OZ_16705 [Gemmatimonadota bacterium]
MTDDFLTVRVGGRPGKPEQLLLIGKAAGGRTQVRRWTSDGWNTPGEELELDARALLSAIEADFASGIPVSEEMYRLRLWLSG